MIPPFIKARNDQYEPCLRSVVEALHIAVDINGMTMTATTTIMVIMMIAPKTTTMMMMIIIMMHNEPRHFISPTKHSKVSSLPQPNHSPTRHRPEPCKTHGAVEEIIRY